MKTVLLGVTAAALAVIPVSSSHAEWFRETVDDSLPGGFACSLVLDSSNRPHIAYWRQFSENFPNSFTPCYATQSGTTWEAAPLALTSTNTFGAYTSIILGPGGRPAIAYQTSGSLLFYAAMNANKEWLIGSNIAADTGSWLSMIWNGTQPRIAASQGTTLQFLQPNGNSWASSNVDTTNAGASCSMDIRPDGAVGIGYIKGGNIRYASSLQGNTPAPPDPLTFPQNLSATRCAFTFDSNGNSHILYYDQNSETYRHITNEAGPWSTQPATVAAAGQRAIDFYGCSIAAGSDGSLHAAFLDYSTNTLKYARRAAGSTSWTIENVDTAGSTGGYCQIQVDSKNRPKIVYHDITNSRLRYAQRLAALSFKVDGKKKRTTRKGSVRLAGSASDSATSIEWRVGKKSFRSARIPSNGKWSLTARGIKAGRNKVQIRAQDVAGALSGVQTIRVVRK